jgi:hypothetical protein
MPAGKTYEPIASVTSTGQATISFTSIPSTYTDLVLVVNGAYSGTTYGSFTFNSDTNNNYSYTRLLAYSGGLISDYNTGAAGRDGFSLDTTAGSVIATIQNYANTTTFKTMLMRENNAAAGVAAYAYLWRSTAAITSIAITAKSSGTFVSGSTAVLYGIKAA